MIVVAIVVLVAGLAFGLGRLTTPSAEATQETTSTTTVSLQTPTTQLDIATWTVERIATTEQFTWQQAVSIETWPLGLFEIDQGLLLFGTPTAPYGPGDGYGLSLWTSQDGLSWESVGQVISPAISIHQVKQSANRLVASGTAKDGSPILLTSQDGLEWTTIDGPPSEPTTGIFEVVHLSDDMLILSSIPGLGDRRLVENALPKEWQSDDIEWGVVGSRDNPTIIVSGPLGIAAAQFAAEALGLTSEDLTPYFDGFDHPAETTLWILSEDGWNSTKLEALQISVVHIMPDGQLVAAGYGWWGRAAWTSSSGRSWTRAPAQAELARMAEFSQRWQGGVISRAPFASTDDLLYSTDFETWESLGVDELLPGEFQWDLYPIAVSDVGIALLANTYIDTGPGEAPPSVSISSDAFTLVYRRATLELQQNEERIVTIPIYNNTPQDITVLDFEQRTITILDPDTDEPLVSFGFDEVRELELEAHSREAPGHEIRALLYSPDGVDWLVQELDPVDAQSMLVLDDRLVVTTVGPLAYDFRDPPQTTIWVGLLP